MPVSSLCLFTFYFFYCSTNINWTIPRRQRRDFYIFITGITSVSGAQVDNIQSSGFGTCLNAPVLRPMGLSTCQWFYFDCNFPAYGYQFRAKCNVNSPAQAWQFTQGTPSEIRLSKTNFCFDPSLRQYIPYEHFGVNF